MENVKSVISRWMAANGYLDFLWQDGYGCHSADYQNVDGLLRYISRQKAHHYGSINGFLDTAKLTFEQEMQTFVDDFDLEHKPEYLFPSKQT